MDYQQTHKQLMMVMFVSELEEIPEDLKFCSDLQVLDITGNPLQK